MARSESSPRSVFEKIVDRAYQQGVLHANRPHSQYRRGGWDNVDDRWKPGGLILGLSPEDREALKKLTAEQTQDRIGYVLSFRYPFQYDPKGE